MGLTTVTVAIYYYSYLLLCCRWLAAPTRGPGVEGPVQGLGAALMPTGAAVVPSESCRSGTPSRRKASFNILGSGPLLAKKPLRL